MKLGAQLYTVRSYIQTEKDLDFTLGEIAKIGYKTVQLSGVGEKISAKTRKELCDKHGLEIVLTHNSADLILNHTEELIRDHEIMNCKYIGLGGMPDKYRTPEWIGHFEEDFRDALREIRDAGMLFMYHNHDFEFEKIDGKYYLDYLTESFGPDELGITLDTYWVQAAGGDVCEWIDKLKDRIPCVHLKDMAMVKGKQVMAPVLEGNMNFRAILHHLADSNCVHMLVEQDVCQESPFVCLRKSYDNVNKITQ